MAKTTGLGWTGMSVDDASGTLRDIRNDCTNIEFSTPRAVQDITGIDRSAMERQLLLADMSLSLNGVFNPGLNASHDVFKTVPSTAVARDIALTVAGQTLGTTPLVTLLPTDYALTRAADGALTWQVPMVLANGAVPAWTAA
jgi:hypothetical protein